MFADGEDQVVRGSYKKRRSLGYIKFDEEWSAFRQVAGLRRGSIMMAEIVKEPFYLAMDFWLVMNP